MRFIIFAACLIGLLVPQEVSAGPPLTNGFRREIGRSQRPSRAMRKRFRWGARQDLPISVSQLGKQLEQIRRENPDTVSLSVIGHVQERRPGNLARVLPLYRVDVRSSRKGSTNRSLKVLVAAGVHGNEPSGVRAAMALVRKSLRDKGLRRRFELTILPMVNPTGLEAGTRYNAEGKDINRSFCDKRWTPESAAIQRALKNESFDLFVDLHGATKPGFFLIRHADDGTISNRSLRAMNSEALLDVPRQAKPGDRLAGIYWLHSLGGVESSRCKAPTPPLHRQLIGAGSTYDTGPTFKTFMARQGTPYSYTLEYSRRLPPKRQVQGTMKLLLSVLNNVARHGKRMPSQYR